MKHSLMLFCVEKEMLAFVTALTLLLTPVQAADFESGGAAFDKGNHATALKEFKPLASSWPQLMSVWRGIRQNLRQMQT
ncbi:MAG TPA: hypothetical protein VK999_06585 [Methylotenera sp.]|nr:hypothetical protein [Methylotenera sp.]